MLGQIDEAEGMRHWFVCLYVLKVSFLILRWDIDNFVLSDKLSNIFTDNVRMDVAVVIRNKTA